jgi:adenosine deaminase
MVEEFRLIKAIPKIELHAHLHGSIRMSTLQELSGSSGLPLNVDSELNLEKCFKLFGLVHKLVSNIGVVKRILKEVIDDYMAENTIYLELRTTPRSLSDGTTVEAYVETLVDLVQQHNIQFGDKMLVKLVLSIDRSSRFKDAIEISELAADYRFLSNSTEYPVRTIVGLDFSGNPYGGKFEDFSPLFDNAKERGLGLTVHTAEVRELSDSVDPRTDEDDTESILNFR